MKLTVPMIAMGLALLSGSAIAADEKPRGVVELFTSQGCNSCPPADAVLKDLSDDGDVLALAFHVDYWNYLGWEDTLASGANTERQYGYSKSLSQRVYTPQVVVNGRTEISGRNANGIRSKISNLHAANEGLIVPVSAVIRNGEIDIDVGEGVGKADVVVAYFTSQQDVTITRGENAGETISYVNSVTNLETVGMWDGRNISLRLPVSAMTSRKQDGCAVLLQSYGPNGEPGPIYGASLAVKE